MWGNDDFREARRCNGHPLHNCGDGAAKLQPFASRHGLFTAIVFVGIDLDKNMSVLQDMDQANTAANSSPAAPIEPAPQASSKRSPRGARPSAATRGPRKATPPARNRARRLTWSTAGKPALRCACDPAVGNPVHSEAPEWRWAESETVLKRHAAQIVRDWFCLTGGDTFVVEPTRRRRQGAKAWYVLMEEVPPTGPWWPAVGTPLERQVGPLVSRQKGSSVWGTVC